MTPHRFRPTAVALVALALMIAAVALAACGGSAAGSTTPADAVRAHVNGREVRQSSIDTVRAEARFEKSADDPAKALDEAIDRELVRQEARRLGVAADQAEVGRRVAAVARQAGGDKALDTLLHGARMTKEQLTAALTYFVLREAVQDARYPRIAASEAKLHAFYRRNRTRLFTQPPAVHLLAVVTRNEGIAANALKRIRQGNDFGLVSRQFTMDPELKMANGDMGWVLTSSLPDGLRGAVRKLRVGQLSRPVQGMGGWYIFKLAGRRAEKVTPYATLHDELAKELTRRARAQALEKWLAAARAGATITRP